MSKRQLLLELARKRQQAPIGWLTGCSRIGDFHDGIYECDHVSPWSKSAHNTEASVMVVGQDWASADVLAGPIHHERVRLGYDPERSTNRELQRLLAEYFGLAFHEVYATNAFPFVKPGASNAPVKARWMDYGVREFLLPQISIVQPRLVVCLGAAVIGAVRRVLRFPPVPLAVAIANPFVYEASTIFAAAHTGRLGMNNRGRDQAERDWAAMAQFLRRAERAAWTLSRRQPQPAL